MTARLTRAKIRASAASLVGKVIAQVLGRDGPLRQVELRHGFKIARYPVTNAEFARFIAARGYRERQWWTEHGWAWLVGQGDGEANTRAEYRPPYWRTLHFNNPIQPVVTVTWYEAAAYCGWLTAQGHAQGWLPADARSIWYRGAPLVQEPLFYASQLDVHHLLLATNAVVPRSQGVLLRRFRSPPTPPAARTRSSRLTEVARYHSANPRPGPVWLPLTLAYTSSSGIARLRCACVWDSNITGHACPGGAVGASA
ncbi:MAG: SUMF1/EgtB/PvdO family nonheme iron enzyme [Chloroflexales bacterium]|nr:SUMF1/EgtB/PvdO family nonheme iron enzyme [Chloroflexales bacterium]